MDTVYDSKELRTEILGLTWTEVRQAHFLVQEVAQRLTNRDFRFNLDGSQTSPLPSPGGCSKTYEQRF